MASSGSGNPCATAFVETAAVCARGARGHQSRTTYRTSAVGANPAALGIVETDIPARLDRLPWGRFHTLVVVALGITWILDGLEVTLAGAGLPAR